MAHEIREKGLLQIAKQAASEIGYKTLAIYSFSAIFVIIIGVTFILTQSRQSLIQSASYNPDTRTFTETFDGDPANPKNFTQLEQPNWDIQIHSRNNDTWMHLEAIQAQHAHDCSAPPASHSNNTYEGSVFQCKNHVMTAINSSSYGAIYLTPNHMVDFSDGPAIIRFDLSTEKMSKRDWWDVTISPFMDSQALPLMSDLSQGVDLQQPNKNSIVIATDNGEGGPNLKIQRNGTTEDYDGVQGWWNVPANDGIAPGTNQAATRQPFQLTVSKKHIKFERLPSQTGQGIVFVDTDIPELSWSKGVLQLGHHSYTPTKDNSGAPATWHWDSVSISPATPFTMIKADRRFTQGGTVNFNSPAPANAYLRFSGICEIKVDGIKAQKQTDSGHPEHMSSYFVPISEGKRSVNISFSDDSWYSTGHGCIAKDFAIWSTSVSGQATTVTPTPIAATLTPTSTKSPTPTNSSPSPTASTAPNPNSILSINPSQSTITSGQTFTAEVRLNTNGQSVNGVETTVTYPSNRLSVVSVTNGTSFDIEAEKSLSTGSIRLAYGATNPKTGNHTIAIITFRANSAGSANVSLANSIVAESSSNTNVFKSSTGATYTVVNPTPTPTNSPTPTPSPTSIPTPTKTPAQKADFNNSGTVDIQDLSYLLTRWGSGDSIADVNGDGAVSVLDLSILLSNWGQ